MCKWLLNGDNDGVAMTLFSIFALRGRDTPSLRGRSNENYEQRMELIGGGQTCTITSVQKDNLVLEIYDYDKSNWRNDK